MKDFLIKVYYKEEVKIKKEFIDSSFDNLDDCFDYYSKQFKFNNISVSPIIDNKSIGQTLHELNDKEKNS